MQASSPGVTYLWIYNTRRGAQRGGCASPYSLVDRFPSLAERHQLTRPRRLITSIR